MQEIDELIKELHRSIKWFDIKEECLQWFQTHDWEGDYSWPEVEQKRFVEEVIAYLQAT